MKRVMKQLLCVAVASVVLLTSSLSVNAAGLKDVFDAEYYAEQYPDLEAAFGNNEKALYQHFLTYGIKEGRVMNPIIDVVKYREQYRDLQTAFGNNWDMYVKHYFEFGVNEQRENGTDFDLLSYLEVYGDVKAAYGNDYLAVAKHYAEVGIAEGRKEGSKEFIEAREAAEAEEEAEETAEAEDREEINKERVETTTYENGLRIEDYYDAEGELDKTVHYAPNGNVTKFHYGYIEGSSANFIHTTYNSEYITYMQVKDAQGEVILEGQYYPAMGMVMNLDAQPHYRFDVSVNEAGNYVFCCKMATQGATLEKGVYTFDPNGECLAQPEQSLGISFRQYRCEIEAVCIDIRINYA